MKLYLKKKKKNQKNKDSGPIQLLDSWNQWNWLNPSSRHSAVIVRTHLVLQCILAVTWNRSHTVNSSMTFGAITVLPRYMVSGGHLHLSINFWGHFYSNIWSWSVVHLLFLGFKFPLWSSFHTQFLQHSLACLGCSIFNFPGAKGYLSDLFLGDVTTCWRKITVKLKFLPGAL